MRKLNYIFILLLLFFQSPLPGNNLYQGKGVTRLEFPTFIPVNTGFEVSLITLSPETNFDEIELFFLSDDRFQLSKAELKTTHGIYKININSGSNSAKISIPIDSTILQSKSFYQIVLSFRGSQQNNLRFKINGNYKLKNNFKSNFTFNKDDSFIEDKDLSKDSTSTLFGNLSFYKPQRTAGKAITFDNKSLMKVTFSEEVNSNLLLDFWMKPIESDFTFLRLKNSKTDNKRFEISVSQNQLLGISPANNEFDFMDKLFVSKKSWYHITIYFSFTNSTVSFYKNSKLFYKGRITELNKASNILLEFVNMGKDKSYQIDGFRVFEYNDELDLIFRYRHFNPSNSDKIKLLNNYTFDVFEDGILSNERRFRTIENCIIVKSDAPLFLRSPEINVKYLGSSYEIEWNAVDFQNASSFVLEKSNNGTAFNSLVTLTAENSADKKYFFNDRNNNNGDIIYYRVKQINNDGSSAYSSVVKIGTGTFETFSIEQNYPNPFNPRTIFKIDVLEEQEFDIRIYNLEGSEIEKIHLGSLSKGIHTFTFDGTNYPSGIYLMNVVSLGSSKTIKMILTK